MISRFTELYCQGTCQHIRLMGKVLKRHTSLLTSAWIWVFQQLLTMSVFSNVTKAAFI